MAFPAEIGLVGALRSVAIAAYYHLYSRISRLKNVREAFREDKKLQDKAISLVVSDLHRAIGAEGELTERMATFLLELSNSGLIDQLAIASVAQMAPHGCLAAFSAMYDNHFSDGPPTHFPTAQILFEKLKLMIRASIIGASSDVTPFFAERTLAQLQQIGLQLDQVLRQQFDLSRRPKDSISPPWLTMSAAQVREATVSIARALSPLFSTIRVEGPAKTSMDVPAENIYVASNLWPVDFNASRLDEISIVHAANKPFLTPTDFLTLLDRAVILGDPGGGKTTFVRMICKQLIREVQGTDAPLSIFITLRKFYKARSTDPNLSLIDFVAFDLAQQVNAYTKEQMRIIILHILSFGRALIIFDGLDEIVSVGKRREFTDAVSQFCSLYQLCRYVVTSRKVGYRKAPLSSFPTFELAPFDPVAIRKYVRLSAENVFGRTPEIATLEARRFEVEAAKAAGEFLQNPLLLSLIVWLFNSTQRMPDNRREIYEECSQLLFEKWDSLRELSPDIPDAHRLFSLLAYIAPEMYVNPELQAGATRKWLLIKFKEFFKSDYSDNAEARAAKAAEQFVDHLAGRAWVLREIGPNFFEFTHRTFLEYFVARALTDEHDSLDSLFDALKSHIANGEWNVPAHLAIQIWVEGRRRQAEKAVQRLTQIYDDADSQHKQYVVEFIAQATEYLQPAESKLEQIASIVTLSISDNDSWKRSFISALQTPNEMRGSIQRGLARGLAELIKAGQLHRVSFILDWLKALTIAQSGRFGVEVPPRLALRAGISGPLVQQIIQPLESLENASAAACKAQFDLTGVVRPNLIAEYGLRLWQASSDLPLHRCDWRLVDFASMLFDFLDNWATNSGPAQEAHRQLAIGLSNMDFRKVPLACSKGAFVVAEVDETRFVRFHSEELPADLAGALCIALAGYTECRRRYRSSVKSTAAFVELVRYTYAKQRPNLRNGQLIHFMDEWIADRTSLFQLIRTDQQDTTIEALLR